MRINRLLFLPLLAASVAYGADCSGRWIGTMQRDGTDASGNLYLILQQTGTSVTGTYGNTELKQLPFKGGTVNGDTVKIGVLLGPNAAFTLNLKLAGDSLSGEITTSEPNPHKWGSVALKRVPEGAGPSKIADVDNTKMGTYRALAQLSFRFFQEGDKATAAPLARIRERSFDQGENDLAKGSPELYREIDKAMDDFIHPILRYATQHSDPDTVRVALTKYLAKLKLAD
jgi:hypothetical protein